MRYPFQEIVQDFFPGFSYLDPPPEVRARCDMRRPDNIVGHQQRAVTTYWAVQLCSPMDLGLDIGSPKGLTPYCIHVDVHGDGRVHPFYGGRYAADVAWDASDVSIFPKDSWPYIASNHSLEHIPCDGDAGIVRVLESWLSLLRPGGVLAMVVPDNDHFDVMVSDRDHKSAWGASDFRRRVLDDLLARGTAELVSFDTLNNYFSFDAVLKKK